MLNPYMPYPVRIDDIIVETEDRNLKTFKFVFLDPDDEERFAYHAGQFAELSVDTHEDFPDFDCQALTMDVAREVDEYREAMRYLGAATEVVPFWNRIGIVDTTPLIDLTADWLGRAASRLEHRTPHQRLRHGAGRALGPRRPGATGRSGGRTDL